MATHSSILAWKIPWTWQAMVHGLARVRHNLVIFFFDIILFPFLIHLTFYVPYCICLLLQLFSYCSPPVPQLFF